MARKINLLVSSRNQQILGVFAGLTIFVVLLTVIALIAVHQVRQTMFQESQGSLEQYVQLRKDVAAIFAEARAEATAAPCTPLFQSQMRQIAYRADSINEVLYAPGGLVQCSSAEDFTANPLPLGMPDIPPRTAGGSSLWLDHGLGFVGLPNLVGTIAWQDPFALVAPPIPLGVDVPHWLGLEIVFLGPDERWWHRGGDTGLYARHQIAAGPRAPYLDFVLDDFICVPGGHHCAVTEASVADLLSEGWAYFILAVTSSSLVAAWSATLLRERLEDYWSFQARFIRHLDAASIRCVYQPIMNLHTGDIAGCEVLARWSDVDGTLVYPDRFIQLVERRDLTLLLTRLVVERAQMELSRELTRDRPFFLTFNIFPRDLDAALLAPIFAVFAKDADRFEIVLELVESDAIDVEEAQREIVALHALGIRTFIDDFGTGYSNIQNLAALAVDGVKLDRAFAMAPTDGVMSLMLAHAIDMVHSAGRVIVVEGVETQERLDLLRGVVPPVDYVQGYFVAHPLEIGALVRFLADGKTPPAEIPA